MIEKQLTVDACSCSRQDRRRVVWVQESRRWISRSLHTAGPTLMFSSDLFLVARWWKSIIELTFSGARAWLEKNNKQFLFTLTGKNLYPSDHNDEPTCSTIFTVCRRIGLSNLEQISIDCLRSWLGQCERQEWRFSFSTLGESIMAHLQDIDRETLAPFSSHSERTRDKDKDPSKCRCDQNSFWARQCLKKDAIFQTTDGEHIDKSIWHSLQWQISLEKESSSMFLSLE